MIQCLFILSISNTYSVFNQDTAHVSVRGEAAPGPTEGSRRGSRARHKPLHAASQAHRQAGLALL